MKIRKYGYSEFKESTELRFAVMVPISDDNSVTWEFITDINVGGHRVWKAENHKKAYLFDTRKSAQDLCIGLAWNFTAGYVVEVLSGMEPSNNWPEKEESKHD